MVNRDDDRNLIHPVLWLRRASTVTPRDGAAAGSITLYSPPFFVVVFSAFVLFVLFL